MSGDRAGEVRRLGDLPRAGRWWAMAVAIALLASPLAAFVHFTPDWTAANDPALMGLRALDVGSADTPLIGQPSQSGLYAERLAPVHHPGPLHFYLMAAPIRLLGPSWGLPAVSVLITGSCLLLSAWLAYRLLGVRGGLVASVVLALSAFTTGAASLINPVSSSIAGYPLLLAAMALWAVAAGDIRVLPLATVAVTFTAQQHLSVLPATAVLCAGALAIGGVLWRRAGRRHDPGSRRDLQRAGVVSAAVALVLWSPVLGQQLFGDVGNLGEMLWFARHGNTETLGLGRAVQQVAHALGLPPLLGRTDLDGLLMVRAPSTLTWVSAAGALGLVAVITWWNRRDPARLALGAMTGVAVLAGLVGGASVPDGPEQARLVFYHWAIVVAVLVALVLGTAVADLVAARRFAVVRPAVAAAAVTLVAAALGIVSPTLDREHNTAEAAYSSIPAGDLDRLAEALVAHREDLDDHTLLVSRGERAFSGIDAALALVAAHDGLELKVPRTLRSFVDDDRLVDPDQLDGGIVLVASGVETQRPPDGEMIARVEVAEPFPADALDRLRAAAEHADEAVYDPGPVAEVDDARLRGMADIVLATITTEPDRALMNPLILDIVIESSFTSPAFRTEDLRAVRDALRRLDTDGVVGRITEVCLYHLDRDAMLDYAADAELGRT